MAAAGFTVSRNRENTVSNQVSDAARLTVGCSAVCRKRAAPARKVTVKINKHKIHLTMKHEN